MVDTASYQMSFRLLMSDLNRALEYVEPVVGNERTYSHRLYELLLRACTDFESLCRDILIEKGSKVARNDMKMRHYRGLEPLLVLEPVSVEFLLWRPEPRTFYPFQGWAKASPQWYENHQAVKHNRHTQFPAANLLNVVNAVSGLFAALVKNDPNAFSPNDRGAGPTHYTFSAIPFLPFVMRWPVVLNQEETGKEPPV